MILLFVLCVSHCGGFDPEIVPPTVRSCTLSFGVQFNEDVSYAPS